MYRKDDIDEDTRVITRKVIDKEACSAYFVTTVEKRGSLDNWSLEYRKETYVRADAERKHDDVCKEQRERAELEREEREKEARAKELREKILQEKEARDKELKEFLQQEREIRAERERTRDRSRDRDYDRGR